MTDFTKHIIFESAFNEFVTRIQHSQINWVLTGSYRLYLEDLTIDIAPKDIDIITDIKGTQIIELIFNNQISKKFKYSETETIRSYFGQIRIKKLYFDVMADVENYISNDEWLKIPRIVSKEFINFKGKEIPVLPLEYEYYISKVLSQESKCRFIQNLIK